MQAIVLRFVGILVVLMLVLVAAVRGVSGMIPNERSWLAWEGRSLTSGTYLWDRNYVVRIRASSTIGGRPVWSSDRRLAWHAIYPGEGIDSPANDEIFLWERGRIINVSQHPAQDSDIAWSPNGQLAFVSNRDNEDWEIYVWNGTSIVNISQNTGRDVLPKWSEDGRLAWLSNRNGNWEVYVWNGNQSLNMSQSSLQEGEHHWTSDGKLLWVACEGSHWHDCSEHADRWHFWDGTTLQSIYQNPINVGYITWSQSGELAWMVAHQGYDNRVVVKVYLWNQGAIRLLHTHSAFNAESPIWSRDGRLAWISNNEDHRTDIFMWDGNRVNILTNDYNAEHNLVWSINGNLAWLAGNYGVSDVFVWQGQSVIRLTDTSEAETFLTWSPAGDLVWSRWDGYGYIEDMLVWDSSDVRQFWRGGLISNSLTWSPLPP